MIGKYISRMVIASAITAAGLYAIRFEILAAFNANPVINGAILAVLALGVLLAFLQVWRLGREWQWVESARIKLQSFKDENSLSASAVAVDLQQRKPVLLGPLATMLEDQQQVSGTVRLAPSSVRYLLDSVSLRLEENAELMRYFVGLLVFIGLLGTFWGLMGTLDSIGEVIKTFNLNQTDVIESIDNIRSGLSAPIAGMGTAFSSSLFGLAGSLFLGLLSLLSNQAQNRFYNELEEWFSSITRLGSTTGTNGGDQPIYVQSLLEHTADALDRLGMHLRHANEQQKQQGEQLLVFNQKLGKMVDSRPQVQLLQEILNSQQRLESAIHQDRQAMTEQLRDELRLLGRMLSGMGGSGDKTP